MNIKIHPAADVFPMISNAELNALANDIKKNGLQHPIELCDGQLIDGRNRLAACELAGVKPMTKEVHVSDPVSYVISANIHRRQLSTQQRAAIAAELANLEHGSNRFQSKKVEGSFDPSINDQPKITLEEAAQMMSVGTATVKRAKQRMKNDPEAHEAIKAGRKPPSRGQKVARAADVYDSTDTTLTEVAGKHNIDKGELCKYRKLQKEAPDLAEKVASGELGIDSAMKKYKAQAAPPPSVAEVFNSLSKSHQKILEKHMEKVVLDARLKAMEEGDSLKKEADRIRNSTRKMLSEFYFPMTEKEYKLVMSMLHPDKHQGREDRAQKAFRIMDKFKHYFKFKKDVA